MKLKKGDEAKVIRGKDKGRTGTIEKVLNEKVLIGNVNQYKRHLKKKSQYGKSEIVTITKPFSLHNVVLICPLCKKPTRVGFRLSGEEKSRICKKCGKQI